MTRFQKALPWWIGTALATLTMAALAVFSGLQYTGNDDTVILRATMGYMGGEPATFIPYMHAAFTWLLYGLAKFAPGVAWFSILQLFLLWISQAVIVKSLCQLARRKGLPLWVGAAAGAVFLAAFALYPADRITYTVTAALCGAAAVAQLASVDFAAGRKPVLLGVLGGAVLLLGCYFLRLPAVLPAACFFLLVFGYKLLAAHGKPALLALGLTAALFAVAVGAQWIDTLAQYAPEDAAWSDARTELFDYTGFSQEVSDETLSQIGWSRDELTLVESWFFLNDNITAEALQTLAAQQAAASGASGGLPEAWATVTGALSAAKFQGALGCLLLAALAAVLLGGKRTWIPVLLVLVGGLALLLALGFLGRLNARAVYTVLLPAGATVFVLLFNGSPPHRAWPAYAALAACAVLAVFAAAAQLNAAYIDPDTAFTDTTSNVYADLDEIALMNDDMLILCDLSLSLDQRLFPDTREGVPENLLLWGGWMAHSESWRAALAKFGITTLDPSLFLRDNVLYASTYAEPATELMNYVSEGADGAAVDWFYYDQWGYVNLFEFDAY